MAAHDPNPTNPHPDRPLRPESFAQATVDALSAHLAVLDHRGRITAVNASWRAFAEANGMIDGAFGVGSDYIAVCEQAAGSCADEAAKVAEGIRGVLSGHLREFQLEYPCHWGDRRQWFVVRVTPFPHEGRLWAVVAHEDVTERRLASDTLRASEERFRLLVSNFPGAIYRCALDRHRTMELLSEGIQEISGFDASSFLGHARNRTYADIIHPADVERVLREVNWAATRREPFTLEYRIIRRDDSVRWVHDRGRAQYGPTGRALFIDGALLDVTERHEAQTRLERFTEDLYEAKVELERQAIELATKTAELEHARAAADAASHAKSAFVANMSHELRTPMTAILGYAELMLDEHQSPEDRMDCLRTIRRNGEHLLAILNDILDLSKIEAGRMAIERIPCSPTRLVTEVVSLLRPRAEDKGIALESQFTGPIPEQVQTDPTRLRQILVNLIGNAIKFTDAGSVRVALSMSPGENDRDGRLRFEVIDSGIGITRDQMKRLFQPFSQADSSTTRRYGGTGLGLAICQRLAGLLSGEIRVDSAPGRGSTFTVTLPAGPLEGVRMLDGEWSDDAEPSLVPVPPPPAHTNTHAALRGRILLAEDGPDNQRLISFHLRRAGLDVTITDNGRAAVETALAAAEAGGPFDLILMDMQMPELDGYAATRELRRQGYRGPIIALTAHAMSGDREKCLGAGCSDYLAKPIDRDGLLRSVGVWLRPTPLAA